MATITVDITDNTGRLCAIGRTLYAFRRTDAETPTHWIMLGYGQTVEDALTASLRQMIAWLSAATRLDPMDIYALASIAGSFRITQYAHQTHTVYSNSPLKAVHGMMPKAIFDAGRLAQISASVRPGA